LKRIDFVEEEYLKLIKDCRYSSLRKEYERKRENLIISEGHCMQSFSIELSLPSNNIYGV
jgi:hypothetical protein